MGQNFDVQDGGKSEQFQQPRPYFRQGVKRGAPSDYGWVRGKHLCTGDNGTSVHEISRHRNGSGRCDHVVKGFRKPFEEERRAAHRRCVQEEVAILRELQDPSVCDYVAQLTEVFEDKAAVYVIMERLQVVEEMEYEGSLGAQGLHLVHQAMYAVHLMHGHGVSHGNLTFPHIGVSMGDGRIKLMGFGKSTRHEKGRRPPPEFVEDIVQLAKSIKPLARASGHRGLQELVAAMERVRAQQTMRDMLDRGVELGLFRSVVPQPHHHHREEDGERSPSDSARSTEDVDPEKDEKAARRFLGGGRNGKARSGAERLKELQREHEELLACNRKYKREIAAFERVLKSGREIVAWR